MPTYESGAGRVISPLTDVTERTPVDLSPEEKKAAQDILGPDTFRKADTRPTVWPEISEGAGAVQRLRKGATPSDIVEEFHGSRKTDIELPSSKGKK